ncbi:MAG: hypothetical protein HY360_09955 [Verrucomicrobia bacterium]|nr:hypothetical protein [Verrucomicrobiota bacterium]
MTNFRIQRIDARIDDHPLRKSRIVVSPAGTHDRSRFLTVIVPGASGQRGYGEAATTALWSGETAETAQWLIENLFVPRLVGHTFGHPREALAIMDRATHGNPFRQGRRGYRHLGFSSRTILRIKFDQTTKEAKERSRACANGPWLRSGTD